MEELVRLEKVPHGLKLTSVEPVHPDVVERVMARLAECDARRVGARRDGEGWRP